MYKRSVFDLQKEQHIHDQIYHQDVMCLGIKDRAKHLVLHFVKYVANLENAQSDIDRMKNLTDFMICVLSMANLLNIDLNEIEDQLAENSLITIIGQMAKACEALDHMEPFPSREVLTFELKKLFHSVLNQAQSYKLDLHKSIAMRWNEIEQKSIFGRNLGQSNYSHLKGRM